MIFSVLFNIFLIFSNKHLRMDKCEERIPYNQQCTSTSAELEGVTRERTAEGPTFHPSLTTKLYQTQYGKRSIGTIGGICLLVNNCLGPGLVQMNTQMQLSGWLPVVIGIAAVGLAAFACSWMLLYSQARVKSQLERVEFTGICEFFFERKLFLFSVLFYILTMIVQCISGIQQTSQLFDLLMVRLFGKSCALEIYPNFFTTPCSSEDHGFSVFSPGSGVVSAGYAISALIAVPFGFFPLEDSIVFQIISCAVMGICVIMLGVDLGSIGFEPSRLPAVGSSMRGLVGLLMFNFSLAFSLPSWNNERKLDVRIKRSIGASIGIGSLTMIVIGVLAGLAFAPQLDSTKNLIDFSNESNRAVTIAAVYVFSLANNVTTIPIFSIMVRYTLIEHKILRKPWIANVIAIGLPWLLVIPFSTGSGFDTVIEFGGSIFIGVTCFVAPPILFLCAMRPAWLFKESGIDACQPDAERNQTEPVPMNEMSDPQLPPFTNKKHVNLLSGSSIAFLALLLASLVYSWYASAAQSTS